MKSWKSSCYPWHVSIYDIHDTNSTRLHTDYISTLDRVMKFFKRLQLSKQSIKQTLKNSLNLSFEATGM